MDQSTQTQLMRPHVVAVVGAKAAGKDELTQYLVQHHGVLDIEVGALARKLVEEDEEGEPHLRYDASAKNLAAFGAEHLMQQLVAELLESAQRLPKALIITGVRTPAEAAVLKANFGSDLLLAYVRVGDQKMRYERAHQRNFTTDPDNFREFVQQDEQLKLDYALAETADLADIILWNHGSLPAFYEQIEAYIVPHLFPEKR